MKTKPNPIDKLIIALQELEQLPGVSVELSSFHERGQRCVSVILYGLHLDKDGKIVVNEKQQA